MRMIFTAYLVLCAARDAIKCQRHNLSENTVRGTCLLATCTSLYTVFSDDMAHGSNKCPLPYDDKARIGKGKWIYIALFL